MQPVASVIGGLPPMSGALQMTQPRNGSADSASMSDIVLAMRPSHFVLLAVVALGGCKFPDLPPLEIDAAIDAIAVDVATDVAIECTPNTTTLDVGNVTVRGSRALVILVDGNAAFNGTFSASAQSFTPGAGASLLVECDAGNGSANTTGAAAAAAAGSAFAAAQAETVVDRRWAASAVVRAGTKHWFRSAPVAQVECQTACPMTRTDEKVPAEERSRSRLAVV